MSVDSGMIERAGLVAAVEQAADGIIITDTSGKIQYVNPAFTAMTGYSSEEAVGQNPRMLKSGRQPAAFYGELWSAIRSGRVWHGELINRRKDGTFYNEEMHITPVQGASGEIVNYIAIKHDVTDRRAAEEARALVASIVEFSGDAIHGVKLDGTIVSWNRGAEALFGYSSREAIGKNADILTPPAHRDEVRRCLEGIRKGCKGSSFETALRAKDGRQIDVSLSISSLRNPAGEVVGASCIARDIGKRLLAERKLRESEERYRSVFEQAQTGMCVGGLDGRFIQVNDAFCRMVGYSSHELLATTWTSLTHPADLEAALERRDRLCQDPGQCVDAEMRYIHRNGTVVWTRVRVSLVRDRAGSPLYFVVHVEDITERKRTGEALQESEERFRIMADGCPTVLWVTNAEGEIQFINRAYREFCGNVYEQVEGGKWELLVHPDDAPEYIAAFHRAVREHTPFKGEARFQRADGQWRWIASYAEPRLSPCGEYLGHVGISPDITDRKQTAQAR
ncbi:MAG TPA: PAS domain S-box protein [Bryobacteraceae bacterium]|nr:PAS domain S-box protein [Bryobacteraceae bacterium]